MPSEFPAMNCNRNSLQLFVLISFFLAMPILVISTGVILMWAFVPAVANLYPNGSKIGGVVCALAAVVVCAAGIVICRTHLHWKRIGGKSATVPEEWHAFQTGIHVTAPNHRHTRTAHTPLQKSNSSAYVSVAAPVLEDTGAVQVLRLLGAGSAGELYLPSASSSSSKMLTAGTFKLTATVGDDQGVLSKVQSEAVVPMIFGRAAPFARNTSLRRSLPKVTLHQTGGSLFVMRNTMISNDATSLTTSLLPKTHSEGVLSSDNLLIPQTEGISGDTQEVAQPDANTSAVGPDKPDPRRQLLSLSSCSRQVISCATLFDEQTSSECDEDATVTRLGAINCRTSQPHTVPCTDSTGFFPLLGRRTSTDLAVMLVPAEASRQHRDTEIVVASCTATEFTPKTSLASRFGHALRRLWMSKKANPEVYTAKGSSKRPSQDSRPPLQQLADTDSASSTSRKPTIVSNASVFSLPVMPPAMWSVDKPVWIMGLAGDTARLSGDHLIFLETPTQAPGRRSITGSMSSIFAFHVRPPPRHATKMAQDRQQSGRRTRSLGRILLSADRQALTNGTDKNNC